MFCSKCGKEIDEKAIICPGCGSPTKKKKRIFKKWWFWLLIVLVFCITMGAIGSNSSSSSSTGSDPEDSTVSNIQKEETASKIPTEFSESCPVTVSASVSDNIIGVPELSCSIKNNTEKEIAAIQLYFAPKDVYGNDVNTIFTTEKLFTDTPIGSKGSCSRSWQMLDNNVKSGDVYVYSVYFSDGTEWGDKTASVSKIKKYGMKVIAES